MAKFHSLASHNLIWTLEQEIQSSFNFDISWEATLYWEYVWRCEGTAKAMLFPYNIATLVRTVHTVPL